MKEEPRYVKAFYWAVMLHLFLVVVLWLEPSANQPVTKRQAKKTVAPEKKPQNIVKAVSVNQKQVEKVVNRLKEEKARKKRREQQRQQKLAEEARKARQARIKEQQRIKKLQQEAEKLALAKKKKRQAEKRRLKKLAEQKAKEQERLQALKNKQEKEARRLAAIKEKKAAEARAAKLKAEKERKERLAKEKAAREKAKKARIAGEVNKYKALIINAISRHWILPDNVDKNLTSQFQIRLAPDGMVLEARLVRSSGDAILDRSARTAIFKASPLPVPSNSEAFNVFRNIRLTVRPEQVRG